VADLKTVIESEKTLRGPTPKSGTQYPYFDLEDSVAVAKAVHERGGGTCSRDLLAATLKYTTTRSGGFLSRIYAAKQFGLIELQVGDSIAITDRATRILHPVMPDDALAARAEAFLAIRLFQKVYDKYKGGALPPEIGLQNLLKTEYKIVEDRVKPALRVMLNSAEQAGFFKATGSKSRMILPVPAGLTPRPPAATSTTPPPDGEGGQDRQKTGHGGGGESSPPSVHPALIAMLRELPRPGTEWPKGKKDRFMTAFRSIVDVVYPDPEVSS